MTTTRLAALLAASVTLSAPLAAAQDAPPAGAPGQREGAPREGGPGPREGGRGGRGQGGGQPMNIEGAMKGMNRALKGLGDLVADPTKKAEALKAVADMQRNCAVCKALPLPAQFTKDAADDAAKAKIQDEYASDLRKTMRLLLDLEDAIVAGKADEAKAILAKIDAMREHAHKELGVDD